MPLITVRENILKMKVDAIVNPTNPSLLTTGGIDKQVQDIEKEYFTNQAKDYKKLKVTDVVKFNAYNLECDYIFNVIGPVYLDGTYNEEGLLRQCYKNILNKSLEEELDSIAIPILSSGAYGFPKDIAIRISKEEIESFLLDNDITVYIVVYDIESYKTSLKYYNQIENYLNNDLILTMYKEEMVFENMEDCSLSDILSVKQPTFTSTLFKFIDSKNLDDVFVYKRANVDRKLFSKIKSNIDYKPSKQTALAFCIALGLDLDETEELIGCAGFTLSDSLTHDKIVKFFIEEEIYDINELNNTLFSYGENILK
ncbi:MAG: macro domain-containing protein [bacterium]